MYRQAARLLEQLCYSVSLLTHPPDVLLTLKVTKKSVLIFLAQLAFFVSFYKRKDVTKCDNNL